MNQTTPKMVLIIRHGEKPADKSDPNLSAAGRLRAQMLAQRLPALYAISALFAAAQSKGSNRPNETIQPLSEAIHVPIDDSFAVDQHEALAEQILHDSPGLTDKIVLICWHHEEIPALAGDLDATPVPPSWPGDDFDSIWQLHYSASGLATLTVSKEPPVAPT
jgi:broad specificity phosphatase PhoE